MSKNTHRTGRQSAARLFASATLATLATASDHLELDVTVDPQRQHLSVVAHYSIPAGELPETLSFYLNANFTPKVEASEQLASYTFEHGDSFLDQVGKQLLLTPSAQAQPDGFDFRVTYEGALPEAFDGDWMEFFVDRVWFPVHESLGRQLTAEVRLSLPADYTVFGRGDVRRTEAGWSISLTQASSDINWVACPGLEVQSFARGDENIVVAGLALAKGPAARVADQAATLLRWFNATIGRAAPEHQVAFVLRPRDVGPGYARPGYIVVHVGEDFAASAGNYFRFFAHEISHLWWSQGSPMGYENWLNESFAEYSSLLAQRAHGDREAFERVIDMKRANAKDLPAVIGVERTDERSHAVFYTKGCVLLYELEQELGEEAFFQWLELLVADRISTTKALLELLEDERGAEVARWFEQKLRS
jgi:hypothetical protein